MKIKINVLENLKKKNFIKFLFSEVNANNAIAIFGKAGPLINKIGIDIETQNKKIINILL